MEGSQLQQHVHVQYIINDKKESEQEEEKKAHESHEMIKISDFVVGGCYCVPENVICVVFCNI